MSDLRGPAADVLGASLPPARRLSREALRGVLWALGGDNWAVALRGAFGVLDGLAEPLADLLAGALLAAHLAGAGETVARLPASHSVPSQEPAPSPPPGLVGLLLAGLESIPPALRADWLAVLPPKVAAAVQAGGGAPPPADPADLLPGGSARPLELPMIRLAVRDLQARRLVTHAQMRALAEGEKRKALAVASTAAGQARAKLQALLAESVSGGDTLAAFRGRVRDGGLAGTFASPAHLETTFRDAVQTGHAAGQEALLADPRVGAAFPWVETVPIRDARLSEMCAIAARSGIQGTAIYRRDDPTWERIKNPRHPRCRCGTVPLTVRAAARKGIREAREWQRTGAPPASPAFVPMPDLEGR